MKLTSLEVFSLSVSACSECEIASERERESSNAVLSFTHAGLEIAWVRRGRKNVREKDTTKNIMRSDRANSSIVRCRVL
jgi:hypothetical protein